MNEAAIILSLLSIILTAITSIFAFLAYSEVVGLRNSTHKVEWMPLDSPSNKSNTSSNEEEAEDPDMVEENRIKSMMKDYSEKMYPDVGDEQV